MKTLPVSLEDLMDKILKDNDLTSHLLLSLCFESHNDSTTARESNRYYRSKALGSVTYIDKIIGLIAQQYLLKWILVFR